MELKQMKVYVVVGKIEWCDSSVLGVFSSDELAQKAIEVYKGQAYVSRILYHDHVIEIHDLDENLDFWFGK